MEKKSQVQQKKSEDKQGASSEKANVIYSNLFLLKGVSLLPFKEGQIDSEKAVEKKFRLVKELEQIIFKNCKLIFGDRTFLILLSIKEVSLFPKGFAPKGLLLDFGNTLKPRLYFLDVMQSGDTFYSQIFPRITRFISYFIDKQLMEKVQKVIVQNHNLRKELQGKISNQGISDLVKTAILKPFILNISDGESNQFINEMKNTFSEVMETVKCVSIRKFQSNGNTICTIVPSLTDLHSNGKKRVPNAPVTEEFHLEKASDEIKQVYKKIKVDLLKIDKNVQFNPQRYYISLRKDRNLAFFHFSKKNITLVVKVSHNDTKKQIKNYEIKALTEKVQKFWGAASCAIVIDNGKKLQEVINLLKKLVRS